MSYQKFSNASLRIMKKLNNISSIHKNDMFKNKVLSFIQTYFTNMNSVFSSDMSRIEKINILTSLRDFQIAELSIISKVEVFEKTFLIEFSPECQKTMATLNSFILSDIDTKYKQLINSLDKLS